MLYSVFFFFFQAEDGIRDLTVTGVQTCALPILSAGRILFHPLTGPEQHLVLLALSQEPTQLARLLVDHVPPSSSRLASRNRGRPNRSRSEERRVGKEGRSRWSPYH